MDGDRLSAEELNGLFDEFARDLKGLYGSYAWGEADEATTWTCCSCWKGLWSRAEKIIRMLATLQALAGFGLLTASATWVISLVGESEYEDGDLFDGTSSMPTIGRYKP